MAQKNIEWELVEGQYRAGLRSLRDIGLEFNVSDVAIIKRARRDGWNRDLGAKIRARAADKVRKDAVSSLTTALTRTTEKELVEANATMQADIIRSHRRGISGSQALVVRLRAELESEENQKTIPLTARIDAAKKLAETLKTLIWLERQSFGLDDAADGNGKDAYEELLGRCQSAGLFISC